jgi:hypothetical protein
VYVQGPRPGRQQERPGQQQERLVEAWMRLREPRRQTSWSLRGPRRRMYQQTTAGHLCGRGRHPSFLEHSSNFRLCIAQLSQPVRLQAPAQ